REEGGALRRSAEKGTLPATGVRYWVCGAEGDDSSHHATETDNGARTITAAANRRFRAPGRPLAAVPFSRGAAPAPRPACNIAWFPAASDDPPGSAGGSSVGTTFAASSTAPGDAFSTAIAVGAELSSSTSPAKPT